MKSHTLQKRALIVVTSEVTAGAFVPPIARSFAERGWSVCVASSPGAGLDRAGELLGVEAHAISSLSRGTNPLSNLRALWCLVSLISRWRPTVILCATPNASLLGCLAARLCGHPLVVHLAWGIRSESMNGPTRWIVSLAEKLTLNLAHDVVANSASLATALRRIAPGSSAKIRILGCGSSHGVDLDRFPYTPKLSDLSRPVIGFVGRIRKDKGVADLLRAARILRARDVSFDLVLLGPLEDPEITRRMHQCSDVTHRAFTTQVPEFLQEIDILCLPTWREGFPNVVLEASATGRPVVTTNVTGAVDSVLDRRSGFIVPVREPELLARRLEDLIDNRELRHEMGRAGRKWVEEHFPEEKICSALVSHVEELVPHETTGGAR